MINKVVNPNEFGVLSEEELHDFELTNKIRLPNDYRSFLLKYNGGKPLFIKNSSPETNVKYILGMHNGPLNYSLYKHIDIYKNRIPFSCFPIATDTFDNLFLMTVNEEQLGYIYFWSHDGESPVSDGNYTENCSFVSYSFSEFLDGLNNSIEFN